MLFQDIYLSENVKALIATGFLGAFTTFSTFSLENILLLRDAQFTLLLLYLSLSIIGGLVLVLVGLKIMA